MPKREKMRYEINGTFLQTIDIHLSQGESVFTESGGMAWMKRNIEMKTGTKGGLMAGLGRKLAGESLFMTTYTCRSSEGLVVLRLKRQAKCSTSSLRLTRASSARKTPLCAPRTR